MSSRTIHYFLTPGPSLDPLSQVGIILPVLSRLPHKAFMKIKYANNCKL